MVFPLCKLFFSPLTRNKLFLPLRQRNKLIFFSHITSFFCQFCKQTFYLLQFAEHAIFSSLFAEQSFFFSKNPMRHSPPPQVSSGRPLRTVCAVITGSNYMPSPFTGKYLEISCFEKPEQFFRSVYSTDRTPEGTVQSGRERTYCVCLSKEHIDNDGSLVWAINQQVLL